MTELTNVKKRNYNIPTKVEDDLVLVNRTLLRNLITEIEDKLDELETITDPDFMREVSMRVDEVESGEVAGINEDKILALITQVSHSKIKTTTVWPHASKNSAICWS